MPFASPPPLKAQTKHNIQTHSGRTQNVERIGLKRLFETGKREDDGVSPKKKEDAGAVSLQSTQLSLCIRIPIHQIKKLFLVLLLLLTLLLLGGSDKLLKVALQTEHLHEISKRKGYPCKVL